MTDLATRIETAVAGVLGPAEGRRFIVGLSGGCDSVALLSAMVRSGYDVMAAHCNFNLRGAESLRDERHAASVAGELGVRLITRRFDTLAAKEAEGGSVEMVCRRLRYDWFAGLIDELGAEAVAIGHHRDDNAETLLLNLMRGTGIAGLRGMGVSTRQPVPVVRPLLGFSREELSDYVGGRGLTYITDSSNLENDYNRNKLRNEVIPAMRRCFPGADEAMALTMENLREADSFIREMLEEKRREFTGEDGSIDLHALIVSHSSARFMLREWLAPLGLSSRQTDDIMRAAEAGHSGRRFPAATGTYLLDRGRLRRSAEASCEAGFPFEIEVVDRREMTPGSDVAYFSTAVLKGTPLHCRRWQQGDRIKPFGMTGSKKVSDIFSDAKIAADRKAGIPLLTKGDDILWVAGLRHSRLYPVGPDDNEIVRVTLKKVE